MITTFKLFESVNNFLLCIKKPDTNFYWKFTEGKKYKTYISSVGTRVKDDNGHFCKIDRWYKENYGHITDYLYAGCILSTAKSFQDYNMRYDIKKYNL